MAKLNPATIAEAPPHTLKTTDTSTIYRTWSEAMTDKQERKIQQTEGVAFVLPKYESLGKLKRVGRFAVFINFAFDRFGIGWQILEAGMIIQIGPIYFGICHINKTLAAFERMSQ